MSRLTIIQRLALRRFLDFLGEATLPLTAKSSSFAPAFNCSRSQTGCAPLPAHVFPDLSRYLTATPFKPDAAQGRILGPALWEWQ
jgi:hypothetical protein